MKKIIYGYGKTGKSVENFYLKSKIDYIVIDKKSNDSIAVRPEDFISWEEYDELIISPGIDPKDKFVKKAIENNIIIKNEIQLAYENLIDPFIICITGTNGKSTTTSMIYELLNNTRNNVYIAGNFGVPFIDYVFNTEPKSIFVVELSSYQIETLEDFKSNISLFLNITPDHLERHGSFDIYKKTKERLELFTTDKVFFSDGYNFSYKEGVEYFKLNKDFYIKNKEFFIKGKKKYSQLNLNIPGKHNIENLSFSLGAISFLNIPENSIKKVLKEYNGLEHRMEFIGEINRFKVYNDSKSTTFESTEAAVSSFDSNIYVILSGNLKKHMNIDQFLTDLLEIKKITKIIVIGKVTEKISRSIKSEKMICYNGYDWKNIFSDIIDRYKHDKDEKILLFSPGMPSFDNFKNFEERGEFFKKSLEGILDEKKKKY